MSEARRWRVYAAILAGFYLLALAFVALKGELNFVVSDGRGYYIYLPSVVIDGDLDFENQIVEHAGVDFSPELLKMRTPTGLIHNRYPIGVALTLTPAFLVAHALAMLGLGAPDGYSAPYQLLTLLWIQLLGLLTFVMIDRILTRRYGLDGRATLLAVCAYWVGSHYAYYYFREPVMAHVVSTFWVTTVAYAAFAMRGELGRPGRWSDVATAALAAGVALVCRPTNAFVGLVAVWGVLGALRFLPLVVVGAVPLLAQMAVWYHMTGSPLSYSYQEVGFSHWAAPKLWQTLFSSRHGLFFWAPVLLLSVWGWVLHLREKRDLGSIALLIGVAGLWYANSAWEQWWFGDAFGGRAFLEASLVWVAGLGFFFARGTERWRIGVALACAAYSYGLMALYITHRIPRADFLWH